LKRLSPAGTARLSHGSEIGRFYVPTTAQLPYWACIYMGLACYYRFEFKLIFCGISTMANSLLWRPVGVLLATSNVESDQRNARIANVNADPLGARACREYRFSEASVSCQINVMARRAASLTKSSLPSNFSTYKSNLRHQYLPILHQCPANSALNSYLFRVSPGVARSQGQSIFMYSAALVAQTQVPPTAITSCRRYKP